MSKVYEIVRDNLVKKLESAIKEEQTFRWVKPWNSISIPKNFITKKTYRGINLLLLDDPGFYITFKQLTELQKKYPFLKLKKGSKKQMVVFWSFSKNEKDEDNDGEVKKSAPIFRYYNVFNQKDIEGFDKIIPDEYKASNLEMPDDMAARICSKWSEIVNITDVDIDRAYYSPSLDCIKVPPIDCYNNVNEYFATKFHEMIHSTGHKDRLNRFEEGSYFGNTPYSKEELVAEIGAQMLMAECGLEDDKVNDNSVAYLKSWLKALKNDITLITNAAQNAQKACDYIIGEIEVLERKEENEEIA